MIAMPSMGDPRFEKSVVFICAHSDDGAMGLIINKPTNDVTMDDLLQQLDITPSEGMKPIRIHFGGPVESVRGFVLHSFDYNSDGSTLKVNDTFGMTASLDVVEDIGRGEGPQNCILALGYAGWGPGQLEGEIQQNGWLTAQSSTDIVFDTQSDDIWSRALGSIGINPLMLSAEGGRA